jgi:MFS family permease
MNKRVFAVLFACFGTIFTSYAIRYSYGIMLPEMLPSLGISKAEAGIIYSSFFIAYSIVSPVLGLISDRYSVRVLIPAFVVILGAGTFLMSYSSSVVEASFYFVLAGIGSAACWAPVTALAQRWASEKRRGIMLSVIDLGSSFGIMTAGTAVPMIVVAYDWRMGWAVLGLFTFLLAVVDFFLIRDRPPHISASGSSESGNAPVKLRRVTYVDLLRSSRFWLIGIAYMFTGFSIIIPFTFLSTYAVQEMAFSYEIATLLIMVIGIGATVGKPLMGLLSDRVGRIRMLLLCAVLIAVGNAGIALKQGFTILIIAVVIFGWGYGSVWSLYAACASDYFPKELAGSIIGLWTLYLGIGCLVAPIVAGGIADDTGTLTWGFYMAVGGSVVSLLLLLPMLGVSTKSSTERLVEGNWS